MANARAIILTEQDIARFNNRIIKGENDTDCWEWDGSHHPIEGYGSFRTSKYHWQAHRVAYALKNGDPKGDLVIDHLCRNRGCVNPAHLECVTERENILRGIGAAAKNAVKTHCSKGHKLEGENCKINGKGHRQCVICSIPYRRGAQKNYRNSDKGKANVARQTDAKRQQAIKSFEAANPGEEYTVGKSISRSLPKGSDSFTAKLDEATVLEIRRLHAAGDQSARELARKYGVGKSTVQALLDRRTWRHI